MDESGEGAEGRRGRRGRGGQKGQKGQKGLLVMSVITVRAHEMSGFIIDIGRSCERRDRETTIQGRDSRTAG